MKLILIPILAVCLAGCSTTSMITPAQLQQTVAASTSLGLSVYPQAVPDVRIAADIICSNVGPSNTSPSVLVQDVLAAGITNVTSKVIINGALLAYQTVFNLLSTNNVSKAQPYLQALCNGMSMALPTPPTVNKKAVTHLQ